MMRDFKVSFGSEPFRVDATVILTGDDIVATFGGGEKYHIGAISLAWARRSRSSENKTSASASVLCLDGHKEDYLAREAARRLAAKYSCAANVIVGLHVNNATKEDIERLVANFYKCLVLVEETLDKFFANKCK